MAWSWLKAKPLVLAGMAFIFISGIAGGTVLVNGSVNVTLDAEELEVCNLAWYSLPRPVKAPV